MGNKLVDVGLMMFLLWLSTTFPGPADMDSVSKKLGTFCFGSCLKAPKATAAGRAGRGYQLDGCVEGCVWQKS